MRYPIGTSLVSVRYPVGTRSFDRTAGPYDAAAALHLQPAARFGPLIAGRRNADDK